MPVKTSVQQNKAKLGRTVPLIFLKVLTFDIFSGNCGNFFIFDQGSPLNWTKDFEPIHRPKKSQLVPTTKSLKIRVLVVAMQINQSETKTVKLSKAKVFRYKHIFLYSLPTPKKLLWRKWCRLELQNPVENNVFLAILG